MRNHLFVLSVIHLALAAVWVNASERGCVGSNFQRLIEAFETEEVGPVLETLAQGSVEMIPGGVLAGRSRPVKVRITHGRNRIDAVLKAKGSDRGKQNELLAFQLDRVLGFNVVPPTALIQHDGRLAVVQAFMKGEAGDLTSDVALFSALTGNPDRIGGNNFLRLANGKGVAIDNEVLLGLSEQSLGFSDRLVLSGVTPRPEELARLRSLATGELDQKLSSFLTGDQIASLKVRAEAILAHFVIRR